MSIYCGHMLPHPFTDSKIYDRAILKYKKLIRSHKADSLMSVTKLHGFFWLYNKPINYNSPKLMWPRTQDTKPLDHINSAIFISSKKIILNLIIE